MLSNADVVERFIRGDRTGKSNRMAIEDLEGDGTMLWGYGWAVYAYREVNGDIYVYEGWYGFSRTTSTHMNLLLPLSNRAKYRKHGYAVDQPVTLRLTGHGGAFDMDVQTPSYLRWAHGVDAAPAKKWGRIKREGRSELDGLRPRGVRGGSTRPARVA